MIDGRVRGVWERFEKKGWYFLHKMNRYLDVLAKLMLFNLISIQKTFFFLLVEKNNKLRERFKLLFCFVIELI
jgi:hypothetical protein